MKANFFSELRADRSELRTSMHYLWHGSEELEVNPPFQILDPPLGVTYAISLWYQSKPRVTTVWLKWPIRFYSGKDLCTEGKLQLLLYSKRAALPTWLSQGTNLASSLKTVSQLQFWWQMQLSK